MTVKKVYKKLIKLDPPKVRHSVASDTNDRIWWYEELEGEILDFAKYCSKKAKVLKGDEGAIARLCRKTIHSYIPTNGTSVKRQILR